MDLFEKEGNDLIDLIPEDEDMDLSEVTESDFLKAVEGKEEDGSPRANVAVSILIPGEGDEIDESDTRLIESGYLQFAIIPGGMSMIDVVFDSNVDFDYLQLGNVCSKFFDMSSEANKNASKIPTLTLSVSPKGDVSMVMTAIDCIWTYLPASPELICNGVRFICKTENIKFMKLTPEQIDAVYDEVDVEDIECE